MAGVVSRLFLAAVGLAGIGATVYRASTCCLLDSPFGEAKIIVGIAVGAALLAIAWFAAVPFSNRFAREVMLFGVTLITAEVVITAARPDDWFADVDLERVLERRRAALALGLPFDARPVTAVVRELRAQGLDAFVGVARTWPISADRATAPMQGFYPLSHASNAVVVPCNEDGEYRSYATDEFGFNNPLGLIESMRVDVAVVGESLVWGHCVSPGESMVDRIRERYPRTANFGLAGTRVLTELASFREYVEPLEPRFVIWAVNTYYAFPAEEETNETLRRYLDADFSQGLLRRQAETDEATRRFLRANETGVDEPLERMLQRARAERFQDVYKLTQVRGGLNMFRRAVPATAAPRDFRTFERALQLADAAVRRWGGTLLVVVLPSFRNATGDGLHDVNHSGVMEVLRRLELETIDGDALFRANADPASLFPLRMENHPNAAGHALLAEAIVQRLARTGLHAEGTVLHRRGTCSRTTATRSRLRKPRRWPATSARARRRSVSRLHTPTPGTTTISR